MASGQRRSEADLIRRIFEEGHRFGFFQLVNLLQRRIVEGVPVGELGPFKDEKLRLRPCKSMSFPTADVQEVSVVETGRDQERPQITVNFMGLYGTAAPTPIYLTELICFTDVDAEPLTDFLDLFNHRLLSMFFRAWLKYRFQYRYARGGQDRFSWFARSFVGMEEEELCHRVEVLPPSVLRYLGLLCLRTRPPVGLRLALMCHYPGIEVRIQEWVPRWVRIPADQRNSIGRQGCRLGADLSVGERVPDRTGKFRVRLGPVGYQEFLRFLPDTRRFADLCALARLWVHDRLDFDVELTIRAPEVPEMRLDPDDPPRLGWTTWITSEAGLSQDPVVVFAKREVA